MNEVFIAWAGLIAIFVLRYLQSYKCVQTCLHRLGSKVACVCQWYSIAFFFLVAMLVRTFWDIVIYDYIGYKFLTSERIESNLKTILEDNPELKPGSLEQLHLRPWLKALALSAPAVGVFTFMLVLLQTRGLIRQSQRVRREKDRHWQLDDAKQGDHPNWLPKDDHPWWMRDLMDIIVVVLANPLLFIVMSMRATIRVLAVMTGSAWSPQHRLPKEERLTGGWDHVVALEMSTFTADLEIAYAVQFMTVWIFGAMCGELLAGTDLLRTAEPSVKKEYKKTMVYAAVQGIYAYVIVGWLRCAIDIAVAAMLETDDQKWKDQAADVEEKFLPKIATIFMFVTLLCIYNMVIIGKTQAIRSKLENATAKFLALRLLLLVAQTQLQILMGLTTGSTLYKKLMSHEDKIQPFLDQHVPSWHLHLQDWEFSEYQAKLMHAALLSYECLLMVVLNLICWKLNDDQARKITFFKFKDSHSSKGNLQAPLMEHGY